MKKILFSLFALVLVTVSSIAQSIPACKLKAKFDFKTDKCTAIFTDYSAAASGTTITNWYWDFGDASTSTLQNPTHTYTTSGTYTVCLTIEGVNLQGVKCKDQFCLPLKVAGCEQGQPCKLYPKFDFKVENCNVTFMDYSASGSGTTITNWYWDFGDGTTSTLQNPSHVYTTAGIYNVCLVIVGNNGLTKCKEQICVKVKVDGCGLPCGVKPLFKFKVDKCTVYFADNSGTNPGTTITSWYWTFGDATTSTLQNPTHTYATAGTYNVCLTTYAINTNGEECKNTYCYPVTVAGCGQTDPCNVSAKFDYKVDKCTIYFADLSAAGAGTTITNWYWSFGDATTSTLQNPTHTYTTAGVYNVCLTVVGTNAAGQQCKNQYCTQITVDGCGQTEPCNLAAKFTYKIDKCSAYFTDLSIAGAGTTITNWYWDFGDGNTSTLQNPTHVYSTPGTYLVCLVIVGVNPTTGEQCKDRFCQEIIAQGCGQTDTCLVAGKFDHKVDGCTVYFTDYSATSPGTIITYWEWNFGDGTTITGVQNPSHVYSAPGNYVVCLIIVGTNTATGEQCKDKICLDVVVNDCAPQQCAVYPKFDYKVDGCTVNFMDYSASGTGTTITNWYWDFGDGNTSALQNPSHVYAAAGTYEVCLIVVGVNAAGVECKDILCLKVDVSSCDKGISIDKAGNISAWVIYPNPAQKMVHINFRTSVAGQVSVSISDIQGRVLDVIQDGQMPSGNHNLNWNVNVGAGLYFITIKTDAGIEQKQLVIQE